jgi:serine/threonine protein kinase
VYGSATNVWGIGCIMHNLVMLSEIGPDPTQPFTPRSINDAAPKCRTFGYDMQSAAYSNSLKDLIFECLYEVPAERPSIIELKERVGFGYDVAINSNEANDGSEPWEDFEMPEPDPFPPQEWPAQRSDTGSSQSLSAGTPRLPVPAKVGSQHLTSAQPPPVVSGAGHPANARPIPPPSVGQDFGPPSVGQPLPNQYAQPAAEGAAGGDHLDVALQSALDYFLFTFQQYRERATNDKQQLKDAKARDKPNTRSTEQTPPPPAAAFMHEKAQPTAPVRNFQQAAAVQPMAEEQQALNDIMNCFARYRR